MTVTAKDLIQPRGSLPFVLSCGYGARLTTTSCLGNPAYGSKKLQQLVLWKLLVRPHTCAPRWDVWSEEAIIFLIPRHGGKDKYFLQQKAGGHGAKWPPGYGKRHLTPARHALLEMGSMCATYSPDYSCYQWLAKSFMPCPTKMLEQRGTVCRELPVC